MRSSYCFRVCVSPPIVFILDKYFPAAANDVDEMSNAVFTMRSSCLFTLLLPHPKSRDSVVGIATSYALDNRGVGVRVPAG
jgi:hypothetical protein